MLPNLENIVDKFRFDGELEAVDELHSGNINNTFRIACRRPDGSRRRYILQQINTYAFKKPEEVMSNILVVTQYLQQALERQGIDSARRVLKLVPMVEAGWMYRDAEGRCWRAYDFIEDAVAYDRPEGPEHFMEAGRAFGSFQRMLFDFPAGRLFETIPDFHNTPRRFRSFADAVAADRAGKAGGLRREIDFFFDRREMMARVVELIDGGQIPLRVTHNDTKMNNVMLDAKTGKGLCVIDLDTVMPGSVLYDYGDAIRFGASTAAEDEVDTQKISLNMEMFRAFTAGFVEEVRHALTPLELQLLPLGIQVITCELAMRFLTDYLDGDRYFKIRYPEHNLVRARAQMKLLQDVEEKAEALNATLAQLIGK